MTVSAAAFVTAIANAKARNRQESTVISKANTSLKDTIHTWHIPLMSGEVPGATTGLQEQRLNCLHPQLCITAKHHSPLLQNWPQNSHQACSGVLCQHWFNGYLSTGLLENDGWTTGISDFPACVRSGSIGQKNEHSGQQVEEGGKVEEFVGSNKNANEEEIKPLCASASNLTNVDF